MSPLAFQVDPETVRRFDRPGPRYTSYPTAVEFHDGVGAAQYRERLAAADAVGAEAPLSLYVHIPFCAKHCSYCGCHVIATPKREVAASYLGYLGRELELVAAELPRRRVLAQMHWGGGTPTYLDPDQLAQLHALVTAHFELLPDAEIAVEVDPRVTTAAHLETLARLGFNRLSLGVQDFTPEVQEAIGRGQTFEQTQILMATARRLGFAEGINLDLVYGLPHQNEVTFRASLERVVELRPDRLALYSFAYVPWVRPNQKRIDQAALPARETKMALYLAALERLLAAGYEPIGMDHFALPDDELARAAREGRLDRNFMGYTVKPASTMIAFGVSGIGDVTGGFFARSEEAVALLPGSRRRRAADRARVSPRRRRSRPPVRDPAADVQLPCRQARRRSALRHRLRRVLRERARRSRRGRGRGVRDARRRRGDRRARGTPLRAQRLHVVRSLSRSEARFRPAGLLAHGLGAAAMKRVVVVGGGIAGLATAFELRQRADRVGGGLEVRVLEAAPRLGGNLRTEHVDGYRVEWGPNGFLDNVPATLDLVRRLGHGNDLVRADAAAARRFLFRDGRLHLLPSGPASFLASPLLSVAGRLRVLGEPLARKHPGGDETVFEFASRRIGREAAAVLVDAMVSGVFAGDSRRLSLASCFPKMAEMERVHGGLVRAMIARQRERRRARRRLAALGDTGASAGEPARHGGPASPGGTLTSFRGGIECFVAALAAALGDAVETSRPVRALERSGPRGWALATGDGSRVDADAVVLAVPAAQAAPLLAPLDDAVAALLRSIPSAPLAVVALAYDARALGSAPDGFGFLVPRGEALRILGCLCDSNIFPGRAPAGRVLLRAMIGGAHDPGAGELSDGELVATASAEVARAMGFQATPERHWIFRHRAGISQYTVGHGERLGAIRSRLGAWPGLSLTGQSYFGISMNACVERAPAVADELLAALA